MKFDFERDAPQREGQSEGNEPEEDPRGGEKVGVCLHKMRPFTRLQKHIFVRIVPVILPLHSSVSVEMFWARQFPKSSS